MTDCNTQTNSNQDDIDDDLTQKQLEANFLQGLQEVLLGQTYPIDKLWDMVDDGSC